MTKYRKLPVVIDAFLWTGDKNQTEDPEWVIEAIKDGSVVITTDVLTLQVHTLEEIMTANPGDYIIKGVKGEIYPCKPDIFEMTYEPA